MKKRYHSTFRCHFRNTFKKSWPASCCVTPSLEKPAGLVSSATLGTTDTED